MSKWNASVDVILSIDYEGIEADRREEAERIAIDRAREDVDYNNCSCEDDSYRVWCCYEKNDSENQEQP